MLPDARYIPPALELTSMSNPNESAVPGAIPAGLVPPELASKANNLQLMGILSIVFGFCSCFGCVGPVLSIIVLVQVGGVMAALQQYGSPPELMSKVSAGKLCAIIGLVITVIATIVGVIIGAAQMAVLRQQAG